MITKTINLETSRILIRKIQKSDAKAMYTNWASDPEVTKYLNWKTHENLNTTKEVIYSWLKQYDNDYFFQWGIEYKENKELIGTISLFDFRNNSLEIGYCLAKKYWNQGIMSEVCNKVIDFAFNDVKVDFLRAKHIEENIASRRVLEKCGFIFTRLTYEFVPSLNKYFNLVNYILLRRSLDETIFVER